MTSTDGDLPRATYRWQLTPPGGFRELGRYLRYLRSLGVSHVYLSPIWEARRGSRHGYDVTDPNRVRKELGGLEGWTKLQRDLRRRGLSVLLDIVPNHMSATGESEAWRDTLRWGRDSPRARWFDIDWEVDRGRIRLPVGAGRTPADRRHRGGSLDWMDGQPALNLRPGVSLPLNPATLAPLWRHLVSVAREGKGSRHPGSAPDFERLARLSEQMQRHGISPRRRNRYLALLPPFPARRTPPGASAAQIWAQTPPGRRWLRAILPRQHWRIVPASQGHRLVNYRRFFQVHELVALHQEDPRVFRETHRGLTRYARDPPVSGFRVDHVDGLADPGQYLHRLARLARSSGGDRRGYDRWIVVEKILAVDETLPSRWPVGGTTGYEFLRDLSHLFVDPPGLRMLDRFTRQFAPARWAISPLVRGCKREAIREFLVTDVERWVRLACRGRVVSKRTRGLLAETVRELCARFPVYRTYIGEEGERPEDREILERVLRSLEDQKRWKVGARFLRALLLSPPGGSRRSGPPKERITRLQQLTVPVMAKGYEDRALYRHVRSLALNEVGGHLEPFRDALDRFHSAQSKRTRRRGWGLLTTSTHDTKRSEDVRARLLAITHMAKAWTQGVQELSRACARARSREGEIQVPDRGEELWVYQTLAGAWPLQARELPLFRTRIRDYLVKSLREAGVHSDWTTPDEDYEEAVARFANAVIEELTSREGIRRHFPLLEEVASRGAAVSLVQVALKMASVGVPDIYQGQEIWDFSLVDPDNRRPVDMALRKRTLDRLRRSGPPEPRRTAHWLRQWWTGEIKMALTYRALGERARDPELYLRGTYRPLFPVDNSQAASILAFLRTTGRSQALLVAALRTGPSRQGGDAWPVPRWIAEGKLYLPGSPPAVWRDILTGAVRETTREGGSTRFEVSSLLETLPVAWLVPER